MFRTAFAALLHLSATSAVWADGGVPGAPATDSQSGHREYSSPIAEDHVRSQLDWRSYYLNRMAVARHDLPRRTGSQPCPPVEWAK